MTKSEVVDYIMLDVTFNTMFANLPMTYAATGVYTYHKLLVFDVEIFSDGAWQFILLL